MAYNRIGQTTTEPFNRQFREIKFHANTIFLRDREIKDSRNVPRKFSRNLSPAKIKENKDISINGNNSATIRIFFVIVSSKRNGVI